MATIEMRRAYAFDLGDRVQIVEGEVGPHSAYLGMVGEVVQIRDKEGAPGSVGERPGDPFVTIRLNDERQDGFWSDEFELMGDGRSRAQAPDEPVPCCSDCKRRIPSGLDVQRGTERRALGWDRGTRDLEMVDVEVVWVDCECGEKIYVH